MILRQKNRMILAEVNLLNIHDGIPLLADIVTWLGKRGWVAYDICALIRRSLNNAIWQADFIFAPESSFLRKDKCWSK